MRGWRLTSTTLPRARSDYARAFPTMLPLWRPVPALATAVGGSLTVTVTNNPGLRAPATTLRSSRGTGRVGVDTYLSRCRHGRASRVLRVALDGTTLVAAAAHARFMAHSTTLCAHVFWYRGARPRRLLRREHAPVIPVTTRRRRRAVTRRETHALKSRSHNTSVCSRSATGSASACACVGSAILASDGVLHAPHSPCKGSSASCALLATALAAISTAAT